VNHTWLLRLKAVPTPVFALEVQRGGIPGHPGANVFVGLMLTWIAAGSAINYLEVGILTGKDIRPE
jgi:hypothetical protein